MILDYTKKTKNREEKNRKNIFGPELSEVKYVKNNLGEIFNNNKRKVYFYITIKLYSIHIQNMS